MTAATAPSTTSACQRRCAPATRTSTAATTVTRGRRMPLSTAVNSAEGSRATARPGPAVSQVRSPSSRCDHSPAASSRAAGGRVHASSVVTSAWPSSQPGRRGQRRHRDGDHRASVRQGGIPHGDQPVCRGGAGAACGQYRSTATTTAVSADDAGQDAEDDLLGFGRGATGQGDQGQRHGDQQGPLGLGADQAAGQPERPAAASRRDTCGGGRSTGPQYRSRARSRGEPPAR